MPTNRRSSLRTARLAFTFIAPSILLSSCDFNLQSILGKQPDKPVTATASAVAPSTVSGTTGTASGTEATGSTASGMTASGTEASSGTTISDGSGSLSSSGSSENPEGTGTTIELDSTGTGALTVTATSSGMAVWSPNSETGTMMATDPKPSSGLSPEEVMNDFVERVEACDTEGAFAHYDDKSFNQLLVGWMFSKKEPGDTVAAKTKFLVSTKIACKRQKLIEKDSHVPQKVGAISNITPTNKTFEVLGGKTPMYYVVELQKIGWKITGGGPTSATGSSQSTEVPKTNGSVAQ